MENYIGRLLDNRYEILEAIGSGGMAVVYKARDHRLKRLIAVKILKEEYSKDDEFRRRFTAESQAVAMLSHPNIVSVYDVNSCDGINYICMELIDGITLKQYMERRGQLNWRETLHFSLQIDKALEHAHGRGIIHRDIKPHNIMILKDGSVKVADFGIARMTSSQNTLTREALGSVHYISPEQAKGGKADCRSDLYSLGVVMYEMMTGKTPFDGDTPVAVAIQHINGTAQPPRELNPGIPEGLEQITMHAMTADLDQRYANATDMLNDLEEFRKDPAILFPYVLPVAVAAAAGAAAGPVIVKAGQNVVRARTGGKATGNSGARRHNVAEVYGEDEAARQEQKEDRRSVILVVILALIAIVGVAWLLFGVLLQGFLAEEEPLKVPNFVGTHFDNIYPAQHPDFVLEVTEWVYNSEYAYGYVVSQTPVGDTEAQKGETIRLVLSRGEKQEVPTMPPLTNLTADAAKQLMIDMKLSLLIVMEQVFHESVPKGTVVNSDPVENVTLEKGQTVIIYVSAGPENGNEPEEKVEKVVVPKVTGMMLPEATAKLQEAGLNVGETIELENEAKAGTVLGQSVYADQEVEKGTKVDLQVSTGPAKEEEDEDKDTTQKPGTDTEKPGTGTEDPGTDPENPGTDPEDPGTDPEDPGTDPEDPGTDPENPGEGEGGEDDPPEQPTGSATVAITLPVQAGDVSVTLMVDGVIVSHDEGMAADGSTMYVVIQGSGTKTVDILIDDVYYKSVTVTFT